MIFNPSFPYRFTHMLLASALTCAFLLAGLSAWQLLRGVGQRSAPRVLRVGLTLAARARSRCRSCVGDLHGLNTLQHQPAKIAAMEGVWEHRARRAAAAVRAGPTPAERRNHFEIEMPEAGEPDPDARRSTARSRA